MIQPTSAKVYFVGAGLGPIDFLTQQAIAVLDRAEVLIYDALVEPELLALLPRDCEKILVGKRGGQASISQSEINQLLIKYCQQDKQIVRLKSGDPWIFGRLLPELQTLQAQGYNYQVIPGISSVIAGVGRAGIPLTAKDIGAGFMVLDGHDPDSWNWQILAELPTLVILMGGSSLGEIVSKLITAGKDSTTPVAVLKNCGRPREEYWWGNLADIVEKTQDHRLSPCVIVIGAVVNQRIIPPLPNLPLQQKTILVTRAADQASQFSRLLQQQGANVLEMPALEITAPTSWQPLDQAIAVLGDFDWLILTSANGVEFFWQRLRERGLDSRSLAGLKIAVVGQKTAQVLNNFGIIPDFIPPNFIADDLLTHFPEPLTGLKILFPRVESGGRQQLVQDLTQHQAIVTEVPAYQSVCPAQMPEQIWQSLVNQEIDVITFASSKTVTNFRQLLEKASQKKGHISWQSLLENCFIASIGPQTTQRCLTELGRCDLEAGQYTLEGLTAALVVKFAKG